MPPRAGEDGWGIVVVAEQVQRAAGMGMEGRALWRAGQEEGTEQLGCVGLQGVGDFDVRHCLMTIRMR